MFNKTEVIQIKLGRNDRWPDRNRNRGFTFPETMGEPIIIKKHSITVKKRSRRQKPAE